MCMYRVRTRCDRIVPHPSLWLRRVGLELFVTEKHESGWWAGLLNDQEGVFPSGFVDEVRAHSMA